MLNVQRLSQFDFNYQPLSLGKSFEQPKPEDFPSLCFKNSPLPYVREHTTLYVQKVLDAVPLTRKRRYLTVDVKVHDVELGRYTCIPGWHCDTVIDPYHQTPGEIHHIFVSGEAALTEFIAEPVSLTISEGLSGPPLLQTLQTQLQSLRFPIQKVPSCRIVTYGRWDFHRASIGLFPEKRLLIRVSETDVIRPSVQKLECRNYG